jgi:hypothetical protein
VSDAEAIHQISKIFSRACVRTLPCLILVAAMRLQPSHHVHVRAPRMLNARLSANYDPHMFKPHQKQFEFSHMEQVGDLAIFSGTVM